MPTIDVKTDKKTYTTDYTKADTDRAVFFGNAHIDNLFTAVAALGAEVWALRRRSKVTESLLAKHAGISPEMIQSYLPSAEETTAWAAERNEFVKTIFESFSREADLPYASTLHPDQPKG